MRMIYPTVSLPIVKYSNNGISRKVIFLNICLSSLQQNQCQMLKFKNQELLKIMPYFMNPQNFMSTKLYESLVFKISLMYVARSAPQTVKQDSIVSDIEIFSIYITEIQTVKQEILWLM